MHCRFCGQPLAATLADLGSTPPANAFLTEADLALPEASYPLHAKACGRCLLVQLTQTLDPASIFRHYAYFSSYSQTWLDHCRRFAETVIARLGLGKDSFVVEVASNDGALLQHFVARDVPCLGIDPAENVAAQAGQRGVPTHVGFFNLALVEGLLRQGRRADLIIANNVLAHVPDINDFVAALARLLAPGGRVSVEFPHLARLMEQGQFDTIYHEHYFYYSLLAAREVFAAHGLAVVDVESLPTHGGSLRVALGHAGEAGATPTPAVEAMLAQERQAGLDRLETYQAFGRRVDAIRRALREILAAEKAAGRRIVAYGAAAKGNTLLNACGIGGDMVAYVVDRNPHKQGLYLPGSHIPVVAPQRLWEDRPDLVLILPWNIRGEIMEQLAGIHDWGGRFLLPIPEPAIL